MHEKALDLALMSGERVSENASASTDYVIPTSAPRFILIHYHILKNAGTTIEFILNREFGDEFARLHGSEADSILTPMQGSEFLTQHPPIRALSSHHLAYPKPHVPRTVVFDICFLRQPEDRLRSFYQHLQRSDENDELSRLAQVSDLPSFLAALMRNHPHLANDAQVNRLANAGAYTRPPNEDDLEKATEIVRQASVLGVVELFDESCVAAEHALGPAFPGIQLHYVRRNVSPLPVQDKRSLRAGKPVYQHLQQMNRLDRELVRRAAAEVRRRFELVPQRVEHLSEFRERCAVAQLAEGACAAAS